ncbi:uncharacterized protein EV422DRAFT_505811 [Fimicolochytrium jonesii]|uniref:uncharacterized protein n=1 Tax=Fimicolochytrium jonesii TaxID=1396493 RepID=UPI0022FDF0D9|nr:uncharacterized protein EV422DRAFT_505811 [Fimicolochytrium jonesii]KAI8821698.1 hypothetical protein EV422DRAFT_505811 [Fimicolochytrium jonesii]
MLRNLGGLVEDKVLTILNKVREECKTHKEDIKQDLDDLATGYISYNSAGRREHDLRLGLIVESCGSRPALEGQTCWRRSFSLPRKTFTKRLLQELAKRNPTAAAYLMMSMPEVYGPHSDEFPPLFATTNYQVVVHSDPSDDGVAGELNPHTGRATWKLTPKEELPEELPEEPQARKPCTQWVAGYAAAPPTVVGEWIFALPEQGFYLVLQHGDLTGGPYPEGLRIHTRALAASFRQKKWAEYVSARLLDGDTEKEATDAAKRAGIRLTGSEEDASETVTWLSQSVRLQTIRRAESLTRQVWPREVVIGTKQCPGKREATMRRITAERL